MIDCLSASPYAFNVKPFGRTAVIWTVFARIGPALPCLAALLACVALCGAPAFAIVDASKSFPATYVEKPPAFEIVFLELIVAGGAIRRSLRNVDIAQCVKNEIDDHRKQQPIIVGRDGCVYSEEPSCNLMLFG